MDAVELRQYPGYRVTTSGLIQSRWAFRGRGQGKTPEWYLGTQWRNLHPEVDKRGRKRVRLRVAESRYVKRFVHVLVLEAFISPRPKRFQACHNDGDPSNNSLANLRWDTAHANHLDKRKHNTMRRGSTHPRAKLTDVDVIAIREEVNRGATCRSLAEKYGVSGANISCIVLGTSWQHIGGPRQEK